MNAHALLTSQGWRGSGHSLHPTSDKTGLSRPLLVSQKANTLGLGKKQHKTADLWWMNAFDKTLKGLDTSSEGKVVQTITNAGLDMVAKGGAKYVGNSGGLYAGFVKGEPLSGTITPEESSAKQKAAGDKEPSPKKRRKDKESKESKEERKARKAAKRASRAREAAAEKENTVEEVDDAGEKKLETKEERRERKRQKRARKVEREAKEVPPESKKKKKRRHD